jgi:hypothetical protein
MFHGGRGEIAGGLLLFAVVVLNLCFFVTAYKPRPGCKAREKRERVGYLEEMCYTDDLSMGL